MQIRNNYQLEWEIRSRYGIPIDKGSGVFNGDMGVIREINEYAELLTVEFDEGKLVEYSFKQLEELEVSLRHYHPQIPGKRVSGCHYPHVFRPSGCLMTRNPLYTAVTRARSCVCLVGRPRCILYHGLKCNGTGTLFRLKGANRRIYKEESCTQ